MPAASPHWDLQDRDREGGCPFLLAVIPETDVCLLNCIRREHRCLVTKHRDQPPGGASGGAQGFYKSQEAAGEERLPELPFPLYAALQGWACPRQASSCKNPWLAPGVFRGRSYYLSLSSLGCCCEAQMGQREKPESEPSCLPRPGSENPRPALGVVSISGHTRALRP